MKFARTNCTNPFTSHRAISGSIVLHLYCLTTIDIYGSLHFSLEFRAKVNVLESSDYCTVRLSALHPFCCGLSTGQILLCYELYLLISPQTSFFFAHWRTLLSCTCQESLCYVTFSHLLVNATCKYCTYNIIF